MYESEGVKISRSRRRLDENGQKIKAMEDWESLKRKGGTSRDGEGRR